MAFVRVFSWVFGVLFLVAALGVVVGLALNTIQQGPLGKEVSFVGVLAAVLLVWRGTQLLRCGPQFKSRSPEAGRPEP